MSIKFSLLALLFFLAPMNIGIAQFINLTPDQLKEDFQIVKTALLKNHPDLYWYQSEEELKERLEQVSQNLDQEMHEIDFYKLLAPLITGVRCGHTHLDISDALDAQLGRGKFIPMKITILDKKAYCLENYDLSNQELKAGDEILSINGKSIEALYNDIKTYISVDGFLETKMWQKLAIYLKYYMAIYFEQPDTYQLVLQKNGKEVATTIQALSYGDMNKNGRNRNRKYSSRVSLDLQANSNIAILKVSKFSHKWNYNGDKKKFKTELKSSFTQIKNKNIEHLILDLRGNTGGDDRLGKLLLSYLLEESFVEFKEVKIKTFHPKPRKHVNFSWFKSVAYKTVIADKKVNDSTYVLKRWSGLKKMKPSPLNYKGKLYVIMDGISFSTTADVTAFLHSKKRGVFIGEESGGGYRGNSSFIDYEFTLPNSGIEINVPSARYLTNIIEKEENFGRGTLPDYPVVSKLEDLLNHEDTQLKFALELINKTPQKQ